MCDRGSVRSAGTAAAIWVQSALQKMAVHLCAKAKLHQKETIHICTKGVWKYFLEDLHLYCIHLFFQRRVYIFH